MTVYYQHIGEKLAARDFPRSLGDEVGGLKRFNFEYIEEFLQHIPPYEVSSIKAKITTLAPTGFQIWGIPSGAMRVLHRMDTGDFLMLLESEYFRYVGQVIHRVSDMCYDLSYDVWGEQRFPIIVLLQGELIRYPWVDFRDEFSFAENYHMRGNTMSLSASKISASKFGNEMAFISSLFTSKATNPSDQEKDFSVYANNLQEHFTLVKSRHEQSNFRLGVISLIGGKCAVCGLDIPVAIEASHLVPKEFNGTDDPRNGLTLCSSHHKMFDRHIFGIEPVTMRIIPASGYSMEALRLAYADLKHLPATPHTAAISWRWDAFLAANSAREKALQRQTSG